MHRSIEILLILAATVSAALADPPKRQWGEARAGLEVSLQADNWQLHAAANLDVQLRNTASAEVDLPATDGDAAFGWLMFQQGETKYLTQRIDIGNDVRAWPDRLAADTVIDVANRDLGGAKVWTIRKGLKFLDAYRQGKPIDAPAAGALRDVLPTGPIMAMFYLYLDLPAARPMLLKSNPLEINVAPPDFAKLPAEKQKAFAADLLAKFDRDAWSAQAAHRTAVKIGKPILPRIIEAVQQTKRPAHSRLWLATTVADIRDERSVAALTDLLNDKTVRVVVAYHGPKQKSKEFDAAVIDKAEELKNSRFIAYALLGQLSFRASVPEKLLSLGLDSPDPRARAMAGEALASAAGGQYEIARLLKLLADDEPRVRATAARVLGTLTFESPPPPVIGALVSALSKEGDVARVRICDALSTLTGRPWPYPAKGTAEEKSAAVARWQTWWKDVAPTK